ncbi:voltage-gated potassium channel [Mollisia scopiformis]|uniref:Voltage-gated potassium channel n=1 Tax=Mollisia scopiformis TaxID=149040 RepID=A0A194X2U0_MOLSC|nr:voltage-gated potassium channel [Mollisia scopiformis]KUJ14162.1 voltage-gated potassium channel [Mollisia scopiformis]
MAETEDSSHVSKAVKAEEAIIKAEGLGKEWFAITAFPLFAGTFGPIATALNVCALVQAWRCENPYATDQKDVHDPAWLTGINAISLAFGVIANLAIMFVGGKKGSHAARHSFYLVLVTIVGGSLASIILVVLVIVASMTLQLPSPPNHAFTEAYYYAIMAAALYFITSVFIVYTAYMLWETLKTRKGRRELSKQFAGQHRSLKILTILFLVYLLLGARAFAKIEGWRYLDAVFWADVTILTVGFGDFKPTTHLGKSLLIPFALCGIFILFLVVYCITQVVFEPGKSMWEIHIRDQARLKRIREREGRKPNKHSLFGSRFQDSSSSETNNGVAGSTSLHTGTVLDHKKQQLLAERAAREQDFLTMRSILMQAKRRRIFFSMYLWLGFAVFLWFFGAALFYFCERDQDWSYFTSIYFTFISLMTIGYGDDTLHSMPGKAVFVLWSLIVVPTLTMLISTGTEAIGVPYLLNMQEWFKRRVLKRERTAGGHMKKMTSHIFKSPLSKDALGRVTHNNHDKNHLRMRAIKSITRDHLQHQTSNSQPDYSFEDWEYMFYLMDILEPLSDDEPEATSVKEKNERPMYGQKGERSKERKTGMEEWQDGAQIPDWLHGMNPLNVPEPVTEWMLEALMEKLESELAELRRREGNTNVSE